MDIVGEKILVIGGAGFIGSHVVELLLREDAREVVVLDNFYRGCRENLKAVENDKRLKLVQGDMLSEKNLYGYIEGCTAVFHLAAAWLLECLEKPRYAVENNIMGTFGVMDACQKSGVKKLIFSSSASVYGDAVENPMDEDHPYNNRTLYGATKIAGEHLLRAYNEMFGLDYVGLRYMNVYGPRQDYRGAYTSVIMKILDRLDKKLPPIIYGDGSQSYDFVYVEDVARANVNALKADATDTFFNVGTGKETTLRDLVNVLIQLMGVDMPIQFEPSGQTFVTRRIGATKLAEDQLRFRAQVDLEAGLKQLIKWRAFDKEKLAGVA